MVEKDLTTWEQFKTALTESITEDTTYYIKNDLDASNDILTEHIKCICSGKNKIFKGNGYKINGITAYGNVTAIYSDQMNDYQFKIYDIKFTNFMVDSGTFIKLARVNPDELFINCFFNGVCKNFIPEPASITRYSYFNKCSFNVRCENFSGKNCYFDSCYIIITPLQKTNTFSSDSIVKNCYVEGTIKNKFSPTNSYLTPNFNGDNVFNCNVIITNYSDSGAYRVRRTSGNILINKDKLLQSDGVTPIKNVASATDTYFLTDEQIKNKDFIQQSTTFPLYG